MTLNVCVDVARGVRCAGSAGSDRWCSHTPPLSSGKMPIARARLDGAEVRPASAPSGSRRWPSCWSCARRRRSVPVPRRAAGRRSPALPVPRRVHRVHLARAGAAGAWAPPVPRRRRVERIRRQLVRQALEGEPLRADARARPRRCRCCPSSRSPGDAGPGSRPASRCARRTGRAPAGSCDRPPRCASCRSRRRRGTAAPSRARRRARPPTARWGRRG